MHPRPPGEQELIDRARGGDADAYADLVRAHQQLAFRAAHVVLRSAPDAEEAVQDAFVKAWIALPRFRAGAPFRPWLLTIVAREAHTVLRARGRRQRHAQRAVEQEHRLGHDSTDSAEAVALAVEQRASLRAHLAALELRDRQVLELRYLLELSEREIAALLGVRPGTVKSRLSRARDRLRERVEAG